jgi:GAF domain-containing protein
MSGTGEPIDERIAAMEREATRVAEHTVRLERKSTALVQLAVACRRLHGTVDREELLSALQDIVCNLVGCEQLAVFETSADGRSLQLVSALNVDRARWTSVPLDAEPVGRCARTGTAWYAGAASASGLTACVPLCIDGHVVGVIALFRLLPQKAGLEPGDHELLGVVAAQAATALHCARLHRRAGGWSDA